MTKLDAWDLALGDARDGLRQAGPAGHLPQDGQHGRRFSDPLSQGHPDRAGLWPVDLRRAAQAFRQPLPETIIEPGRGMVGNAGAIKAEVVLVSRKSDEDDVRWVFSTSASSAAWPKPWTRRSATTIVTPRDGDAMEPCVLAGPTCDSADVLYEKTPYPMPVSLTIGDEVLIEGTGAYTTTYSAVAFNGFEPLRSYVI
jgi:ornithine decarboxylase